MDSRKWTQLGVLATLCLFGAMAGCYDVPPPGNTARFRTVNDAPPEVPCSFNDECDTGQVCYAGSCVRGCRSTSECEEGLVCKGAPPVCVFDNGCDNDTECLPGERCHPNLNTCVDCLNASDCAGDDVCNIAEECRTGARECQNDDFTCGGCTMDEQCGLVQCDVESGRCVDCSTDEDCPGNHCDLERFVCAECYTDEHCSGDTPACFRDEQFGNLCVGCLNDDHCLGGTCNTETNLCEGCASNEDCEGGTVCNATSGLCFNPTCVFQEAPARFEAQEKLRFPVPFARGEFSASPLMDTNEDGVLNGEDLAFFALPREATDSGAIGLSMLAVDGTSFWSSSGFAGQAMGQTHVDLNGDGLIETIALRGDRLVAYSHDGEVEWTSGSRTSNLPQVSDVNQDGVPDFVVGNSLFDGQGNRLWSAGDTVGALGSNPGRGVVVDIRDEPGLEVVAGGTIISATGDVLCTTGIDGWADVADLDGDGSAELVVVEEGGVGVYDSACQAIGDKLIAPGHTALAGRPLLLNIDNDAELEIVYLASSEALVAYEHDGQEKWTFPLTGAAPYGFVAGSDLDANTFTELYVQDSQGLHVVIGLNGAEQALIPRTTPGSIPASGPLLADIDGDQAMEIAFLEGEGASAELVAFEDVRDRWKAGNNFSDRSGALGENVQVIADFAGQPAEPGLTSSWSIDKPAPNLVVRNLPGGVDVGGCPTLYIVIVGIANLGAEPLSAGALVRARSMSDGQVLLETTTQRPLRPGDEIFLQLDFVGLLGNHNVEVVVTPSISDQLEYGECELGDNRLVLEDAGCGTQ